MALVSQALVGPARDEAGNGHEDAVIKGERVAKDVSKDADVFHRGQRVRDDDADTGEVRIVQFLLRRERMGRAAFVGQGDAALRRVVVQPVEAAVSHERISSRVPHWRSRVRSWTDLGTEGLTERNRPRALTTMSVLRVCAFFLPA